VRSRAGVSFAKQRGCMMSERRNSRRSFLKTAAGLTAGTVLTRQPLWAERGGIDLGSAARAELVFPRTDPRLMITPDEAWDWNAFKAEGGPTYAGSAGWKRFTDFLIAKMLEFGAIDLDYVEIPYDHYIVEDWPDRRTHIYDSGKALAKLVTDGTPVPVVASYGMTSGSTPPGGVTAPMLYYDPAHPPAAGDIAGKILVFQTVPYPDPPYSNAFLDNFTLTDYEWRSPGKWPPLFTPPPTSVTSSYHCRWVWSQPEQICRDRHSWTGGGHGRRLRSVAGRGVRAGATERLHAGCKGRTRCQVRELPHAHA
jgi:hypothetical protein